MLRALGDHLPTVRRTSMSKLRSHLVVLAVMLASSVAHASTRAVSNSSQLSTALEAAAPGDVIVLADGSYAGFTVRKNGITVQAAHKGRAEIASGIIRLSRVSDVTVQGLTITTSGSTQTVDGESFPVAIWFEACTRCRLAGSTIRLSGQARGTAWVMLSGNSSDNRIDHDELGPNPPSANLHSHFIFVRGNRKGISTPSDRTEWASGNGPFNPNMARHTRIDHNYFHDMGSGSGESIVAGGLGLAGDYQDTDTVIEDNLFENCDGDPEVISVKSSGNVVRNNTIRTSGGLISLRSGNHSVVTGNLVLAGRKPGSGGVKVYEHGHVITGNYVEASQDYAYVLGAGDAYTYPSFSHAPAMETEMDDNVAVGETVRGAIIGHGGSGAVPVDCSFSNNTILGTIAKPITISKLGNTTMTGNRTTGPDPPLPHPPLTAADVGPRVYSYSSSVANGTYKVVARHSHLAMAVQGASSTAGAPVIQYAFGGAATNDEWRISLLDDGYYQMLNDRSLLSLDVAGGSTAPQAGLEQWTYHDGDNQQVSFEDMGDGSFRIRMHHSGLCLNVSGASTANGASIIQYPCGSAADNERWILTRLN
jgi:hypothetical protein